MTFGNEEGTTVERKRLVQPDANLPGCAPGVTGSCVGGVSKKDRIMAENEDRSGSILRPR